MIKKGLLISVDGLDLAGKSTQVKNISNFLLQHDIEHITTTEPGATEFGKVIKKIILQDFYGKIDPLAEYYLFLADRVQHISEIIIKNISAQKHVITDRYADSTIAYQIYARKNAHLQKDFFKDLSYCNVYPDLTFILDISPEVANHRLKNRTSKKKDFDLQPDDFKNDLRNAFLDLAKNDYRYHIINANRAEEEIFEDIKNILIKVLDISI